MRDMPRKRKPFIQREQRSPTNVAWYFRRGKGPRIRLPGAYGSSEFEAAYEAALSGQKPPQARPADRRSVRWLIEQYQESGRFHLLAEETQSNRRRILKGLAETAGNLDFRTVTRDDIQRGRVRREATPYAAQNYVKVVRALFKFAVDSTWISENPADGVSTSAPETDGHHTWTVEEVLKYWEKHPIGTQACLALDLLLFTGLRRGDVVKVGKQHIRDGRLRYRAQKNKVDIDIPLLAPLARSIEATKTGDLALLCNSRGRPWVKESFGSWFAEQCIAAGVPGRAHGLRKAGATLAAEGGASSLDLAAMFGWKNPRMADVYTKKANRARLAEHAANALFPHFESAAGAGEENAMKSTSEK